MAIILDGKKYADEVCENLKKRVNFLNENNITPELMIVTASEDPASKIYVRNKIKRAEEIGIAVEHMVRDKVTYDMLEYIEDRDIPVIIQMPCNFDEGVNMESLNAYITAENDVDGFVSNSNVSALVTNQKPCNYPCTPRGIIDLLKYYGVDIAGKNVCVIGRSKIVGMPLSLMLNNENATVTVCHSKTPKEVKYDCVNRADIIVSATGCLDTLTFEDWDTYVDYGAYLEDKIIVDVGTNRKDGHLVGDIPQEIKELSKMYTPSVGGVGPVTVIELCRAVVEHYEQRCEENLRQSEMLKKFREARSKRFFYNWGIN